jgi:starch synthase
VVTRVLVMTDTLKVWFLAPEVVPFAKTGGLADVAGSLPVALRAQGVDVRVGLPFYRGAKEHGPLVRTVASNLEVPLGGMTLPCNVLEVQAEDGGLIYFFDRKDFFDREELYGTAKGDYSDNLERFAYFSRAALLFAKTVGFDFDVVHCHDWQTALAAAYLRTVYREDPFFQRATSVFTIHNVGYQGLFAPSHFAATGLPPSAFRPEGVEYWGNISLLKAGIQYATAITTVSPRYSREIQTPEFGLGMDGILSRRSADLYGILNGANYSGWDPARDPYISAKFSVDDLGGKKACKDALIDEMGLNQALRDRPLLAVVSRLTVQKGYELLLEVMDALLQMDVGVVILASGEHQYQQPVAALAQKNHGRVAVKIGFDEGLSHRIIAGADMLLVPSRYEPCGLTQLYALRYGTVPIVRATGGLDDTIFQFDRTSGEGTGFKFGPFQAQAFLAQVREAIGTFFDKATWETIARNGMRADFSWEEPARKYISLYEKISHKTLAKSPAGGPVGKVLKTAKAGTRARREKVGSASTGRGVKKNKGARHG